MFHTANSVDKGFTLVENGIRVMRKFRRKRLDALVLCLSFVLCVLGFIDSLMRPSPEPPKPAPPKEEVKIVDPLGHDAVKGRWVDVAPTKKWNESFLTDFVNHCLVWWGIGISLAYFGLIGIFKFLFPRENP